MAKQTMFDISIDLERGRQMISDFCDEERTCDGCYTGCTMGCNECDVTETCGACRLTFCNPDCDIQEPCDGCKCYGCDGCPYILGR